jgi:hypothetical protein
VNAEAALLNEHVPPIKYKEIMFQMTLRRVAVVSQCGRLGTVPTLAQFGASLFTWRTEPDPRLVHVGFVM